MTLGEFKEFTKDIPDDAEFEMQIEDIVNEDFFNVKADVAIDCTHFFINGKRNSKFTIVFFEEGSEDDGGGQ